MFAALQRRWRWVFGGGLFGLALVVGSVSLKSISAPLVQASLIVNVAQGPCYSRIRQLKALKEPSVVGGLSCFGETETVRQGLTRLVKSLPIFVSPDNGIVYSVGQLIYEGVGRKKSPNHLLLSVTGPSNMAPQISAALTKIQKDMTLQMATNAQGNGFVPSFGADWIRVEKPSPVIEQTSYSRSWPLGLMGGLVVGTFTAMIADRRSNRVYSKVELLRRLGYPLRLGLPAGPWTSSAVQVLVGQLATQLDRSFSWKVLSIARQNDAVAPLTKLLQQQGSADLHCDSAEPLLAAVLRMESSDRPTGLLLVVQSGFNSARALEEARLLISQMSTVQSVGIVLIGAPLPEELSSSAAV